MNNLICARKIFLTVFLGICSLLFFEAPALAQSSAPVCSSIELNAVILSDDDGGRKANISDLQIQRWLDFANKVYAPLGLNLKYCPAFDRSEVRSTLLNSMYGVEDDNWIKERYEANAMADSHPGKLTVFFRFGPGTQPTGQGFSSHDYNFIAMPGYSAACHCGHEHLDAFAHELGHYLGLAHTFPRVFADSKELSAQLSSAGNPALAFDGDGLEDTLPDPLLRANECSDMKELSIDGHKFSLPRKNIMSYYDERDSLSLQQQQRAAWVLGARMQNGMRVPSNSAPFVVESESLKVDESFDSKPSLQNMQEFGRDVWSKNTQLFIGSSKNGALSFVFVAPKTGKYRLNLFATRAPDFSIVEISLDGKVLKPSYDMYGELVMPSGPIDCGIQELSQGNHRLGFRVIGKNPRSGGYHFGFDGLQLLPGH